MRLPAIYIWLRVEPSRRYALGTADCIFCKNVRKEAPAHVVHEDARTLAFMDIFPVADGHTLIIPKAHCDDLFGADPGDLRAVMDRSREIAHAIGHVLAPV